MTKEVTIKNPNESIGEEAIATYISDFLPTPSKQHMEDCGCQDLLWHELYEEIRKEIMDDYENGAYVDEHMKEKMLEQAYPKAMVKAEEYCRKNKVICPLIKRTVINSVKALINAPKQAFDLNDPIIMEIIKNTVMDQVSALEMQIHVNRHGVVTKAYSKDGSMYHTVSNVEKTKQKFRTNINESLIALNNAVNGQNINVTVDDNAPIPIGELYTLKNFNK